MTTKEQEFDIQVPRKFRQNIQYRKEIRAWAMKSQANRDWLMEKCRKDFVFFIETFCWLIEPRPDESGKPQVIPFIPWTHQRPTIDAIVKNLGFRDIGIEKARGEGASWICLMIILWRWLFYDMQSFGLVSMKAEAADNPEDPNSLGWKLDWQLNQLPLWMVGKKGIAGKPDVGYTRNISKHTWVNCRNGATITAYAATGDLASGGRKTAFFMDELSKFPRGPDEEAMSATEPVTNCRLLVSTPNGAEGAYWRCMIEPSSMVKLTLAWEKNPTRNENMFTVDFENRTLISVDTKLPMGTALVRDFYEEWLPVLVKRGFDVTSKTKVWSPWYVSRCLRPRMTPKKIAQEYDRDYGGSASRFFPSATIEMLIERSVRPQLQGEILIDQEKHEVRGLTKMKEGLTKFWCRIDHNCMPPVGLYTVGVDVCTGQGGTMSSCSSISVIDRNSGKKVMEYADPNIKPEQLACLAVAVCKWFRNHSGGSAYLIWEGNGPGGAFRNFIIEETTFRNFYYRVPHRAPNGKETKEPGWWSGKEQKRDMLSRYRHALVEGHVENLSEYALRECLCYIEDTGGRIVFISGHNDDDDPANDGENHGDRVIADGLASYAMHYLNGSLDPAKSKKSKATVGPPEGSFGYRRKLWMDHLSRKKRDEW